VAAGFGLDRRASNPAGIAGLDIAST